MESLEQIAEAKAPEQQTAEEVAAKVASAAAELKIVKPQVYLRLDGSSYPFTRNNISES